jgi:ribosomal protein L29
MLQSRRVVLASSSASEGRGESEGGGAGKADNRPDRRGSRARSATPPPQRGAAERLTRKPIKSLGPIGRMPTEQLEALGSAIDGMSEEEQDALAQRAEAMEESLMRERMQRMDDGELRAYVDTVLDKYGSLEFVEATLLQPFMLEVVSEQLGQEDAALLSKLLVRDASTGDVGAGLNTHRPRQLRRQLAKLKRDERARLPGLLERLQDVQNEFHVSRVSCEACSVRAREREGGRESVYAYVPVS